MKKSNQILWTAFSVLLGAIIVVSSALRLTAKPGLGEPSFFNAFENHSIVGSGKIVNKTISVAPFDTVNVNGKTDVEIIPGKQNNVLVSADDNILPLIDVSLKSRSLDVGGQTKNFKKIIITSAQMLHKINLGGKTILHASNINADHFSLAMGGKSDAYLSGNIKKLQISLGGKSNLHAAIQNADSIDLTIGGKATVFLSGTVKHLTITSGGKVIINAKNLNADDVAIHGAGESNILVHAAKTLSVTSVGKNDVRYIGNPKVENNSIGNGIILKSTE